MPKKGFNRQATKQFLDNIVPNLESWDILMLIEELRFRVGTKEYNAWFKVNGIHNKKVS